MTFFTLQLRRFPDGMTPEQWETSSTRSELLRDLDHPMRRVGPYQVGDWAKARGLDIFYIDNCWLRVPVKEADLDAFSVEILKETPPPHHVVGSSEAMAGIVALEVEEF